MQTIRLLNSTSSNSVWTLIIRSLARFSLMMDQRSKPILVFFCFSLFLFFSDNVEESKKMVLAPIT